MKGIFDSFHHYMELRIVLRIYLPKPVFKACEKSAIFIALMVVRVKDMTRQDKTRQDTTRH